MSRRRARGFGIASRKLCCGIVFAAGIALAPSVPAASATPVKEVVDTVGSTVRSVPPEAAPSLPSAAPEVPQAPPASPAAPPPPPPAPPAPHTGVESPTKAAPTPSTRPNGSGAGAAFAPRRASATTGSVDSVASTGREGAGQAVPSARDDGGRASAPPGSSDAASSSAGPSKASGTAHGAPASIAAAEVAALQRWFAYVWPAISLGGGEEAGPALIVGMLEGGLLRPAVVDIPRLLSLVPAVTRVSGDSPPVRNPATGSAPQRAHPPYAPAPGEGGKLLYLVALVALLALLAFTVWRELRSALRPHLH